MQRYLTQGSLCQTSGGSKGLGDLCLTSGAAMEAGAAHIHPLPALQAALQPWTAHVKPLVAVKPCVIGIG